MRQREIPGHDYPQCASCRHVIKMGSLDGLGWTCKAFPDEIPVTIVDGTDDHTQHYPGDHGVRFEPGLIGSGAKQSEA